MSSEVNFCTFLFFCFFLTFILFDFLYKKVFKILSFDHFKVYGSGLMLVAMMVVYNGC